MSIESQTKYLQTSLEALKSIDGLINEFAENWKRDNNGQLPLPIGLDSLRRNYQLLIKSYKQCSSASATHASNIVRQLNTLESVEAEKSEHLRSAAINTACDRIEKSFKIIGGELGRLRERNVDLRQKISPDTNNQKLNETLTRVGQLLDKLDSSYSQVDLKKIGSIRFDDLQKSAADINLLKQISQHSAFNEAKVNFDKLQNAFQALNNIDL